MWSFVPDLLILDEQSSMFRQSKQNINHLLWYGDPDRLLVTPSKGEMCQNKILRANIVEFGQNLNLKCQLLILFSQTRL